jgi:hypothetical protein
MAYDRYESRREWREPRGRFRDEDRFRGSDRDRDERGWFERAGDEVASWFGDEEADRRRRADQERFGPERFGPERNRAEHGRERFERFERERSDRDRDLGRERAFMSDEDFSRFERSPRWRDEGYRRPYTGRFTGRQEFGPDRSERPGRPYRPFAGDYGRGVDERLEHGGSYYGVGGGRDRHYDEWRARQIHELDRDYDDYRREHQQKFESDFGSWRERRQSKRQLLGQVREHMEVLGSDNEHVGTVDRVAGDRLILTKSDPESGGAHHSLMCTSIDRIEGDKVFVDMTADQAKKHWRDESRQRALFEREDQGEAGPGILGRSFSGTY